MFRTLEDLYIVTATDFNKGKASKIFRELQEKKKIVVMKNNKPIAVITKPES